MDSNAGPADERRWGDVVEAIWAATEGVRRANYRSLWRLVVPLIEARGEKISYEGFRLMVTGELAPRADIMEETGAIIGLDPRPFPEYQIRQVEDAIRRHPDLAKIIYPQVMAMKADLEQSTEKEPKRGKGRSDGTGPKRPRRYPRGKHKGSDSSVDE
jgi:hypothetical protein